MTGTGRYGPDFQNLHRNKRCLTINLKEERGLEIFFKLVRDADVVVENFRAEVKHRLGVDYESVRKVNPRIVYGSISGFGQDGPYRSRPGVDQIAQGMGGLMSITGLPGSGSGSGGRADLGPLRGHVPWPSGCWSRCWEREKSGEGQWVHTSLLEAQISMLDFQAARWLISKEVPPQAGNNHPTGIPMGVYPTADGHINIAAPGDRMFRIFCKGIGAEELLERPEYADSDKRSQNRDALNAEIDEYIQKRESTHWIDLLNELGIPCGPINSIDQTFADPQVRHLGIATPLEHPKLGSIEVVGQPVNLTRTPQRMRCAAPDKGADTDEVLASLGYDQETIAELRDKRVV